MSGTGSFQQVSGETIPENCLLAEQKLCPLADELESGDLGGSDNTSPKRVDDDITRMKQVAQQVIMSESMFAHTMYSQTHTHSQAGTYMHTLQRARMLVHVNVRTHTPTHSNTF